MTLWTAVSSRCRGRDEGAALVAAIGVVLIGMMLVALVVAQAVMVTNDSGRDRARTYQVHGAEGAVDEVYGLLEAGTPCRWPATGERAISTAPGETGVVADIEYFDEAGAPIDCLPTGLSAVPAQAVITATAESGELAGEGLTPRRTVQARVLLDPLTEPGNGAAIFSSYANGGMTNNFTLASDEADGDADIWIDSGDIDCNSNVVVQGRLFVADGKLDMSNNCTINKDVRVKGQLTMNQGRINGDAYSYTSNGRMNGTQARIEGDLTVAGTATNTNGGAIAPLVGGAVTTGWVPPSPLKKVPLPEVVYKPADWAGFSTSTSLETWLRTAAETNNAPTWVPFRSGNPCGTQLSNANWSLNGNLVGPSGPTIIDARSCNDGFRMQNITLTLRGDLVIFAKSFNLTNTVNVVSDGGDHTIWLIVPDQNENGVAQCPSNGNIEINSQVKFVGPKVTTFLYSPCNVSISNHVQLHGQVYGQRVKMQNNLHVTYRAIGIPGVDLFPQSDEAANGFQVEIVYKREIGTPTP